MELCSPALFGEEAGMDDVVVVTRGPGAGAAWLLALRCPCHQPGAKPSYVRQSTMKSLRAAIVICGLGTSSCRFLASVSS